MGRKRIELNDRIEKLSEKYMAMTGMNLDELTNKALKFYIVNQLSSHKVKRFCEKMIVRAQSTQIKYFKIV